jgi:hypothetical protein
MALFVALSVVKIEDGSTVSIGLPTSGNGGIVFESYSTTIGSNTILSKITVLASGLNQKATVYYSTATVAALVALMV